MREQQGPAPGTASPAPPPARHLLLSVVSTDARRREAGAGSLSAQGHRTAGESQNPPASARLPPPWPRAAPWTPLPLFSVTWICKTFVHSDRSCETLHFRERLAGSSSRSGKLLTKARSAARRGALATQGQGASRSVSRPSRLPSSVAPSCSLLTPTTAGNATLPVFGSPAPPVCRVSCDTLSPWT